MLQLLRLFHGNRYLKLKESSRVQYSTYLHCVQWIYCLTSLPCPPKIYSSPGGVAEDRPTVFQQCLISGRRWGMFHSAPFTVFRHLSVSAGLRFPSPALLPVVFGNVVCQPVHFGFPALPQGFIKLQSEVLQCLLISFPKGQGVLQARGTNQCTAEQVTAQPGRCLLIRNYSTERRNGIAISCF